VERMMRDGLLPYIKLSAAGAVRFRLADLMVFVEERVRRTGDAAGIADQAEVRGRGTAIE
jgi:hypothetical protein